MYYRIPDETDVDPIRQGLEVTGRAGFKLGVYKAKSPWTFSYYYNDQCLHYGNGVSDSYLNAGAAEGSARVFGTLAAALGGVSMLAFFGLAATEQKSRFYMTIFMGILCAAALFQVLIFVLMASDHCSDSFWNEFLSISRQNEETTAVSCEMGDGGWYALAALILYILAALLVALKWSTPSCSICSMEWTKDLSSGDSSNLRRVSDEEEQLVQAPIKAEAEQAPPAILPEVVVDESPSSRQRHHSKKVAT